MTDVASQEPCYLSPEELRIGVFVVLELPWFKHPFTMNSFKIRNADQLKELRALRLQHYRYDPDRTDPPPAGWVAPAAKTKLTPPPAAVASSEPVIITAGMAEKLERIEALKQHREKISGVERAFTKASAVMRNLNRNLFSRPKETLEEMGELVGQMIDAFLESPEATLHVMSEKTGGEDVYYHSLNVTILSIMLAKELGFTPDSARELGVGAMLHDVGKIEIPDRLSKASFSELTKPEQNLYQMHVDYGTEIGRKLGLSPDALAIITQHHEFCDGTGYPKALKESAMTFGARLVSMVNYYDNLCNPHDISKAVTPHEALSLMFSQRSAKFEKRALQLLIRSLGVYPPGSIVLLSNEAFGTVISVNPQKPLRPCVLIYDSKIPKEEALMLDLDKDKDVSITKSIRPALLPPQVLAYLNPRKHVTYYFEGESGAPGASSASGNPPRH